MRLHFITLLLVFHISLVHSQTRMVMNNDAFLVIENSAYLVIDNPNANAITTVGTGGNIVSEDETDVIKWEINTATGTYVIPWTTNSGVKIPLSINKTTAGTGATSEFILSTYETATDLNIPYPSAVTNMNLPSALDGSLWVADRFWHINALSYTAKPDITLIMTYDPAVNELGGTNTLTESNLLAQRFNTTLGHWETAKLFGTNDASNDRVTGIVVPSSDFFENWILVDNLNPLPVELVKFEVNCTNKKATIEWTTLTEINNDYFVVEKSYDAVNFYELAQLSGAGNSNTPNYYLASDQNPSTGINYYRLKQVDFDGTESYHEIKSSSCNPNNFTVDHFVINNNSLNFNIATTGEEIMSIFFYDYSGKVISKKSVHINKGINNIKLNNFNISRGIYLLSIIGEQHTYAIKLHNGK